MERVGITIAPARIDGRITQHEHSPLSSNCAILASHPNEPVGLSLSRKPGCSRIALDANRRGYTPDKPLPRKAIPPDIRSLCRSYTAEAIRHLAAIMRQPEYPPAARVQAASVLLDRGWGKAVQPIAGEDGEPLRVVIRQIADAAEVDPVPTKTTAGLVN